ncbi:PQQ-binding-like beta-propeller repeat protein [Aromatoleum toluclasticum]|uniref:outer membrane protein assembly factor BamB family protein n=1 Tax=Aromatoleum toluclasticum TaxID=92003 RepID=UPI001D19714A|nr:PQQ-binding-like beta-propeller repeat protein [Aromatoleum toluclasticum]MCC4114736.1 PQQ-binding-like beta-propeller repeat protein [Aromatoleum toluclasticum]
MRNGSSRDTSPLHQLLAVPRKEERRSRKWSMHGSGAAIAVLSSVWALCGTEAVAAGKVGKEAEQTAMQASATGLEPGAGKASYEDLCSDCHLATLRGTGHGPELAGPNFMAKWQNLSAGDLLDYINARMPPGSAGKLIKKTYEEIALYILERNGSAPASLQTALEEKLLIGKLVHGQEWTPRNGAKMSTAFKTWESPSNVERNVRTVPGYVNRKVEGFDPVTDADLANPPPSDWLSWRRTLDGQGYSPLDQINKRNVSKLKLSWALAMGEGSNQATPLVRNGIMYLTHPGNVIQAINASTGEVIWEYAYEHPAESKTLGGPTRTIAIYKNKLFLATYDAALVAINAVTGEEVWKAVKADYIQGYTHTSGPLIAGGVVVSGINGCERYKDGGCFITGHDPDTGRELWRTQTISSLIDPGKDSWGGLPLHLRAGGDTWIPGSYDPILDTFYIGTSQPKPWVAASRSMTTEDAALYTNSTLALDPKSGQIKWYFQHIPGETIDMEVGLERVLVDIDSEKLLVTVGKDGILWALNRESGDFISATETIRQNVFENIDHKTGKVTYRKDISSAGIGDVISACPGIYGGHNWQASAYYPENHSLIIPLHQLCVDMVGQEVQKVKGYGGYGGNSRSFAMPDSNGNLGRLSAYDLKTMEEIWRHEQPAMFLTGALVTGGGLVFVGDVDRKFKAFDVDSGAVLWQTTLGAPLHGYPITYKVGGKQYVAVPTGMGVLRLLTTEVSPQIYQPKGGSALYVFELME